MPDAIDVLPALDGRTDRIRQHLREALHLDRGEGGIDEASRLDHRLEAIRTVRRRMSAW